METYQIVAFIAALIVAIEAVGVLIWYKRQQRKEKDRAEPLIQINNGPDVSKDSNNLDQEGMLRRREECENYIAYLNGRKQSIEYDNKGSFNAMVKDLINANIMFYQAEINKINYNLEHTVPNKEAEENDSNTSIFSKYRAKLPIEPELKKYEELTLEELKECSMLETQYVDKLLELQDEHQYDKDRSAKYLKSLINVLKELHYSRICDINRALLVKVQ